MVETWKAKSGKRSPSVTLQSVGSESPFTRSVSQQNWLRATLPTPRRQIRLSHRYTRHRRNSLVEPCQASAPDAACTRFFVYICPAAFGRGAFDIVRENVTQSVCLSLSLSLSLFLYLSDRELPNANSEPIELGMVLNEGEDRKTLLRRGRPLRRCLVLEI